MAEPLYGDPRGGLAAGVGHPAEERSPGAADQLRVAPGLGRGGKEKGRREEGQPKERLG